MFVSVFVTVLSIILALIYVRWMQVRQYWAKRKVAHLPPHPILGSITFLKKRNPTLWMKEIYNYFKEPYMGIWLIWQPVLIVNSPEIGRKILLKDFNAFRNRYVQSGSTDRIGNLLLFALNDPVWSHIRKRLTFLFTGAKMRGMQNLITTKARELIHRIEKEKEKSEPIELRALFTDYTTDIVGRVSFGVEGEATLTGESVLRTITKALMEYSFWRGLSWQGAFFFPNLVNILRLKMYSKETMDTFKGICWQIIAQRGGYEAKVTEPRDLIDILVKIKQEDKNNECEMTDDMLVAQAITFLQGGFDTTATTITFCIYELAHNPEIQEKLLTELQDAERIYGEDLFDSTTLSKLTYLNCVINEELRKFPIMGWLDRIATVDYKIDENLTIAAGTPVYVNTIGMHYDPEIFPEPYKFNPDRFLPDNEMKIEPFTYLPFGDGPRKCIGQRFALTSVRYAVATIILKYEVRTIANSPLPSEVQIDKHGLFLAPGENVYVDFIPRT